MKILAADDNAVARSVLRVFLEQAGFEPVIVENGEDALRIMLTEDPPPIAILDWMMPGWSGLEVCTRLRATQLPLRPYIILLTARSTKADIADGLDAGADEFITKPFNQVEMLARLRVARRMVDYERELQSRIAQAEAMLDRYRMLEDIVTHPVDSATAAAPATPPPEKNLSSSVPGLTADDWLHALRVACTSVGWPEPRMEMATVAGPYKRTPVVAWAGYLVVPGNEWHDLLIEMDHATADALFLHAMRRPAANDRVKLDFIAETANLLAANIKATLQNRDAVVISPFLSCAMRASSLSRPLPMPEGPREQAHIVAGGHTFGLTISRQPCEMKAKSPGQLNPGDVLAESFQPSADYQIPLLNRGTVLTVRFIERMTALARSAEKNVHVPVFERSPLAAYFAPTGNIHSLPSGGE